MIALTVTKDTVINDILMEDMDVAPFFLDMGMHCIGCFASMGETVEEACMVHGVEPDDLIDALNEYFASKGSSPETTEG
ncbi:MAG: DUF1858 domain-containing protein [Oscillospiraceae bacterium]|nr:DUF1858 domain-containing protein [Oscillospiraceae bacterium]